MVKLLLVDDDKNICELVSYNLKKEGFHVDAVTDGKTGYQRICAGDYDLIILDIMLPGMNGTEICKQVRAHPRGNNVPIIMLSARGDEVDKIVGLEIGADDYVVKPFSPRELVARVNALLRRVEMRADSEQGAIISIEGIEVDDKNKVVRVRGKTVDFTPKEFALLEMLMRNSGQAFSREYLLERVWGYDYAGDTRTVDVHVRHIRQKIELDPSRPALLQTVRSYGYRFRSRECE